MCYDGLSGEGCKVLSLLKVAEEDYNHLFCVCVCVIGEKRGKKPSIFHLFFVFSQPLVQIFSALVIKKL